ncbi:MAG: flagellar motor protein PomA [Gammaproteobacteria bacterium]|nr:flagellar motor protein PomA [Gammaproteobacteria bacterium]
MDFGTLFGLLGGLVVLYVSIAGDGGSIKTFMNLHPVIVVFGGSLVVTVMKFGFKQFFGAFKVAGRAFLFKKYSHEEIIEEAVKIADAARKGGLLSLEGVEIKNDFMKKGIQLLIDGHEPEVMKKMLSKEMNLTVERHQWGQKVFKAIGEAGPAMGMIGTLMGLVLMMSNMSDPKSIGPAMAIALLATFYGAVLANMVALPIAEKLELRSNEERLSKSLVIDALHGIQIGQNPRVIEEALKNYLPRSKRGTSVNDAA